jgi:hypothetical protein
MFELFLARVDGADPTGQIHRRCTARPAWVHARLMPLILRAFSRFVAAHVAPAGMAAPGDNSSATLQAAAS